MNARPPNARPSTTHPPTTRPPTTHPPTTGALTRRALGGATALHPRRRWHPSPYLVVGGLFWLVMTLASWRVPMCCDFGQHAAVVERLKVNLLHPSHPTADLPGAGSPYYSPYTVAQGAFARLTGLAGWEVVRLAAPLNLLVVLTGLGRLVHALNPDDRPRPWAPVLALGTTTLLWGTERAWWSGYLNLMSMTGNLSYPSTFAIGLTFWAWAWTARRASPSPSPRPARLGVLAHAALGALYALILLVHPITAVASLLGAVAFVVGHGGRRLWSRTAVPGWTVTGVTTVALAALWPYFDVFVLPGDSSVDTMHRRLYVDMPGQFWLALLLGLPALALRARRSWRDPLVLLFALECVTVTYGWLSGHYTYGRILGLTLLPLQLAPALELAPPHSGHAPPFSRSPSPRRRRLLGGGAAAGACLAFFTVHAGAVVPRSLDPVGFDQPPQWPSYAWAARHIRPGEAVIADGYWSVHLISAYGADLAAPAWPDPALDETERQRRLDAVHHYLDPTTSRAERTAVASRYHVRWLLLTRWRKVPEEAVVVDYSRRTGEVLARVGGR